MINKSTIGKIIQSLRKEKHLTQEELAEKIDISPNYLSKVERGLCTLNTESFLKMAQVLDFTLESFGIKVKNHDDIDKTKKELISTILSASQKQTEVYNKTVKFIDEIVKY